MPAGATDEERQQLDELWAAECAVLGRLSAFNLKGHVGQARKVLAEAEGRLARLEEEKARIDKRSAPGAHSPEERKRKNALPAELDTARTAVAEAGAWLDKVLASKQELMDERDEVKGRRHAVRLRVHERRLAA